jgi:hypothetical protein
VHNRDYYAWLAEQLAGFATPDGDCTSPNVTARATKPGTARWCTTVTVRPPDHTDASTGACGNGLSDGFHGAYIGDCAGREITVVGLVAPDISVGQANGLPASQQVHYFKPPSRWHLRGRLYVLIAVPTGAPIRATRAGTVIRRLSIPASVDSACRKDILPYGYF